MQKVKYRVFFGGIIVTRWRIDVHFAPGIGGFGEVAFDSDVAMRHIFQRVVIPAFVRDFNAACHAPHAVEGFTARIGHGYPVNQQRIVMKTPANWLGGHDPEPAGILYHVVFFTQINLHFLGFRGFYPKNDAIVR